MQVKKAARTTIVSTTAKPGIKDNVAAIFGAKLASSLELLEGSNDKFAISGVISSAVKVGGKTNGHPQFFFINSRPVDIPKAVRVVNDVYRCDQTVHFVYCSCCVQLVDSATANKLSPCVRAMVMHACTERPVTLCTLISTLLSSHPENVPSMLSSCIELQLVLFKVSKYKLKGSGATASSPVCGGGRYWFRFELNRVNFLL
jgi:hypothetical protein